MAPGGFSCTPQNPKIHHFSSASAIQQPTAEPPSKATQDTGAPEGDLPQREKHPPTTLYKFERGDQGSQSLFRRGRAGMTAPPRSVVGGCAEPSVDGMTPQESDGIAWRHRFRRHWARLAPFTSRHSCGLGHQHNKANFIVAKPQTKRKQNKRETNRTRWEVSLTTT